MSFKSPEIRSRIVSLTAFLALGIVACGDDSNERTAPIPEPAVDDKCLVLERDDEYLSLPDSYVSTELKGLLMPAGQWAIENSVITSTEDGAIIVEGEIHTSDEIGLDDQDVEFTVSHGAINAELVNCPDFVK